MKKIITTIIISIGLLSLSSCNDFIDQKPKWDVVDTDIYGSEVRLEATLRGLYGYIKNSYDPEYQYMSFIGGKGYMAVDVRGDDILNVTNNNVMMLDTYNMLVNDVYADNTKFWINAYQAINRTNIFLEGLEYSKENEVIDLETYEMYKSEALFVRAITYFYLNNFYGQPYALNPQASSVPLRLSPEKTNENNNMPLSSVEAVYNQILTDLSDANINKMMIRSFSSDSNVDYAEVTRATQAAAYMLKIRVYMAMNKWDEIITLASNADFQKAINGYGLASDITSIFRAPYYGTETVFSLPMASTNKPNTQLSLYEYYSATENILLVDVTAGIASKANYNSPKDARISQLMVDKVQNGYTYKRLYKYTDNLKLDWVPVFRLAELKLNLAEAYMSGTTKNSAAAKALLKEVRHRSLPATDDQLDIDNLSDADLTQAIYNEKRLEFLGEGIRAFDMTRRLETIAKGKDDNGKPIIEVKPGSAAYIWPIPSSEKLLNEGARN